MMAIHDQDDGVLARRHIWTLFFSHATTLRALQKVLARLVKHRFIKRTTFHYRRFTQPRSEPIYWLDYRGILRVAERLGAGELHYPKNERENQMRRLERSLRQQGIRWLRELLSIDKLEHNFLVVDFRMKLARAVASLPSVRMEWVNESAFRSPVMDRVVLTIQDQAGQLIERERGVCPDGFCLIQDVNRRKNERPYELHLLIEMDMGTHPVSSRFATDKAVPYAAYIGSSAFKARFDADTGDWLVITTGERRMQHLIEHTQEKVGEGARWFLFSTWQHLMDPEINVLTAPVWLRPRWRQKPKPWALLVDKR
jgi:hypothetical protein